MSSSFTRFRGGGFWSNDATIGLWLIMLSREVSKLADPPEWLIAAAEQWRITSTCGMVGCVSACLDEYATSPARIAMLENLSRRALESLQIRGEVLSVDWLNAFELGSPGDMFTQDLRTEMFTQVGEAFLGLLIDQFTMGPRDAPHVGP